MTGTLSCTNCSTPMERIGLEGIYGPEIEVDLCYACHVMWLDKRESIQLAPGGTLDLFRVLHQHTDDPRHALGERITCPRCHARLTLMRDIGKGGRFSYYACPKRHGRLTPFSEFLKEKQFVRALNPAEQHELRSRVKQVQCSSCGAPVDLAQGFQCGHCGSPLTVLDSAAVEKTLKELDQADAARSAVDPGAKEARARALAAMEQMRTYPEEHTEHTVFTWSSQRGAREGPGMDLLSLSIGKLFGGI